MAATATARSIPGAVATLGVSDRVTFLRKTYAHLGGALIAFALVTWLMMNYATEFSLRFTAWGWSGWNFLFIFLLFIGAGVLFVLGLVIWIGWTIATVHTPASGEALPHEAGASAATVPLASDDSANSQSS
jgi:FtsH-binding integral membrane protein